MRSQGLEGEIYPEYSKLRGRALAESVGILTPALLAGPIRTDELDLDSYGNAFVIKPDWGTASRGVLVLARESDDYFHELIENVKLSREQVLQEVDRRMAVSGRGSASQLIVERSMAAGTVRPQEWKIFAFHGEVGLIQQMDRDASSPRLKLYAPDGTDAGALRRDVKFNPALPKPENFGGLIEAAKTISLAIPTGFVRVDLFEQNNSIVLGELCLIPGGDLYFRKGWDKKLGELWNKANVRILSDRQPLIP